MRDLATGIFMCGVGLQLYCIIRLLEKILEVLS